MKTSLGRLVAPLVAVALLLGACSDGGGGGGGADPADDPKQAFSDALEAFGDYEGITLVMTLQADAAALAQSDTPPEAAEAIVNSSFTMSAKGTTPEDSQVQFLVNIDGNEDAVEFRGVDQSFYVRADVRELVETFGGNMAEIDAFVQQASAQGFDFAEPLVDGEWVGVEGIDELVEQFGGAQPTPDPEQVAELTDRMVALLEQNADVTSEGSDDTGEHLVVSFPIRETVQEFMDLLQGFGGLPQGAVPPPDLSQIPNADIPIDVWLSDGRLVQVELDFIAIAEALGEEPPPDDIDELALRIALEEFTGEVEAPSDFVEIDVQEILQGFLGAAMGSTGSGAVPPLDAGGDRELALPELGIACTDLQALSPEEIEQFLSASGVPGAAKKVRKACPELF
ncbi:MAG TPA: hypothetical protein VHN37_01815 [Actinomycetota bacterium]|nr:hypothetical protein [Actinomycetota bacterium]